MVASITETHPQVILVSPEQATEWLSTCTFPRQRKLRVPWVIELAEIIRKEQWATTTITFTHCKEDGKTYLLDGYHRLNAIVRAQTPAPLLIHGERCATLAEAGVHYSRLDRGV